jgi:1,4-dihydroxy-6-naphthoate synthase
MKSKPVPVINKTAKKVLSLGFSPCPNDTFMFDAIVNGRIDAGDLSFDVRLEDIETLNLMALREELDITKVSYAAFSSLIEEYQLLTSGSALGKGVGPLFISKKKNPNLFEIALVAIPGRLTTAFFLFQTFFPQLKNVKEYLFSDIEAAVLNDEVNAGVIIHENRFTYETKGLHKIADLGELWERKTNMPIPLGGIAVRNSLSDNLKKEINLLLRQSIEFAFRNPSASREYVKKHSQEMSDDVIQKHINLYVNEYSINLDSKAKKSILDLLTLQNPLIGDEIFVVS